MLSHHGCVSGDAWMSGRWTEFCFFPLGMSSRPSYRVLVGEKLSTTITTTKQPAMINRMKKLAVRKGCDS